ncbi:Piso0_001337 [Millerozyma farinosa CBS 7064]|uniref:Piso0_001337 protein n=1 Tax=Pichia sorbitophila (strain ATCC MYA-4447 / BCRC 22081 / CBS 7064 / NBRC 10061 / NRRL Y-12695) TaxID=559304 RepID=G8YMW5_PICSO|nr:Piso0_001337 [Millerozyma farinosa CBS 7064]
MEKKEEQQTGNDKIERNETKSMPTADDDLDDLDDLLDDFADDVLSKPPGATLTSDNVSTNEDEKQKPKPDEPLNDEFKVNIDEMVKDLNIEDEQTKAQFEQLVNQFQSSNANESQSGEKEPDFDNIMKETMARLKRSGDNIDEQIRNDQSGTNAEDVLSQLMSGLDMGGGEDNLNMSKLLVDMLEQLSSKEVLYEPIKDLNTKFPPFLKEKEKDLPSDTLENYKKQYEITGDILKIFEDPEFDDKNEAKREKINSLLESLQELGQPPSELIGDATDFPGFGGLGGSKGGNVDFDSGDLPKDFEKNLEEGCKQT